MKPHPRIRKTVKWGGAAVTVLFVAAWAGSGWGCVIYSGSEWGLQLNSGCVGLVTRDEPIGLDVTGWRGASFSNGPHWGWWFQQLSIPSFIVETWVPLWVLGAPILGLTLTAWHLDTLARRRARVGRCPKCNYDRTGLAPGAVCPECGQASPTS